MTKKFSGDSMINVIKKPKLIKSAGNKPKIIEEFIGKANSQTADLSIARMKSPSGWEEPVQSPEFDEYTLVLKGSLRIKSQNETIDIKAGEAVIVKKDQRIQYSTPGPEGAEYIAVCVPAFSPHTVHRDA
jgi:ethanolamine utilization protein EutQ (cupin superfamily)